MSDALDRAITAVNLLETTVRLMVQTCALMAQTGDESELERLSRSEYVRALELVGAFADRAARRFAPT